MIGRKKKPKVTIAEVTNRLREFIMDSQIQDGHEMSVLLGATALSDEVLAREEEESDLRVDRVGYLLPLIYAHAHLLAEGAVEYQRTKITSSELKDLPEELWAESRKMMEQISLSAIMGSVTQLVDMGLLEVPKKHARKRK